jgi:hypothetical protein
MKINEVIIEGALRTSSKYALPDAEVFDDLDNGHPYYMYRFGVALAGSPDNFGDINGPTRSNLVTIGYTDADREIIDAAKRHLGRKSTRISKKKSQEMPDVNRQSPVQPKGPVRRKSK